MFAQLLDTYFKYRITFNVPASGLAFWIRFNDPFSLTHLQKKAREKGLLIPSICLYQDRTISALRLGFRSEEHTSELQSLMRISYAVFCLKKKKINKKQ